MKRTLWLLPAVGLGGAMWIGAGCASPGGSGMSKSSGMAGGPPFGGPEDVKYARSLWDTKMRGYTSWAAYPGLGGWQDGRSPHGKVLRYFINSVAAKRPARPGNGAIIVKENYGERNGPLMAVTVMEKRRGYDPEDADWFWVKYGPSGDILTNPKGMKLAGRVAKGMPKGCIACHRNAAGGDFLFVND
ncbi:MAG: cytochrome P460 family protein [Phycisphaerae bacterium]